MGFSKKVARKALVASGRSCCICHKFCGPKIELHHIIQRADGGDDLFENCIPLCFDCHAEVRAYNPRHPKGRKYTEKELKDHRNQWYYQVQNRTINKDFKDFNFDLRSDRKTLRLLNELMEEFTENVDLISSRNMTLYPRIKDVLFDISDQIKNMEFNLDEAMDSMVLINREFKFFIFCINDYFYQREVDYEANNPRERFLPHLNSDLDGWTNTHYDRQEYYKCENIYDEAIRAIIVHYNGLKDYLENTRSR